ncbi:MAG: C25 family cysteine peptidase [Chloroflexota bacterium]|nr:hypothetical protein [Chloroflexota bacterium]
MSNEDENKNEQEGEVLFNFNGLNGATGEYLLPPLSSEEVAKVARSETYDESELKVLRQRTENAKKQYLGLREGRDPLNLAQAGWGVVFLQEVKPEVRDALKTLLDWRKEQAGDFYKEFVGEKGYRRGEDKAQWLGRQNAGSGAADPRYVPYYLLIVGDPVTIPFEFQYQLDVQYAVGRIYFDTHEEYAHYAQSVVEFEKGKIYLPRRATFFGVQNQDDLATNLSARELVIPLANWVAELAGQEKYGNWQVNTMIAEEATKARLGQLLGGEESPALLFTASHGMGFPMGDTRQVTHQGALVCQDWPGPQNWQKAIPPDHYFAAEDVSDNAQVGGLISFHFACFGAGTPRLDDFPRQVGVPVSTIAEQAFVAQLPKRLLGHSKGGALAVIGHVERAWGYSFKEPTLSRPQTQTFEDSFKRLLENHPVGSAFDLFNMRYAETATELNAYLQKLKGGGFLDKYKLARLWTTNNDARSYIVLGDPAVRLPVRPGHDEKDAERLRPILEFKSEPPNKVPASVAPIEEFNENPSQNSVSTFAGGTARSFVTTSPYGQTVITIQHYPPDATIADFAEMTGEYEGVNFILGRGDNANLKEVKEKLIDSLKEFTDKLGTSLKNALTDFSGLEVTTYVSENLDEVTYHSVSRQFKGPVTRRALTHIKLDGDTLVCVPEKEGEIDEALWAIHRDSVQQAQAHRAELIKTAASVASGLVNLLKGLG